jgi:hypothetical protein
LPFNISSLTFLRSKSKEYFLASQEDPSLGWQALLVLHRKLILLLRKNSTFYCYANQAHLPDDGHIHALPLESQIIAQVNLEIDVESSVRENDGSTSSIHVINSLLDHDLVIDTSALEITLHG